MPYAPSGNAEIYYEEWGQGEPVIAVHGLIENTGYFTLTGVAQALARTHRVILMDMRAHGRTKVHGEPWGYDVETTGRDIEALAGHLELSRFHLLSHSTGGFASVRYAMNNSHRLISLILTDTSSATCFFRVEEESEAFHDRFAQSFEKYSWEKIMAGIRMQPFPFFRGIADRPDKENLYDLAYRMIKDGDRAAIGRFIRSFYKDPDPQIEGLRQITCPTLILVGDKDDLFLESSQLMNREIKNSVLKIYENTGHMLAIERPEQMAEDVLEFLAAHS